MIRRPHSVFHLKENRLVISRRSRLSAVSSIMQRRNEPVPVMDYRQHRRAQRLVHECCNYDHGNCIALDRGDSCVCVQRISYSLLCKWFIAAVLPLDCELQAALFYRHDRKRCTVCGRLFHPGSNRAVYCADCSKKIKRQKASARKRRQRQKCHALGPEKAL